MPDLELNIKVDTDNAKATAGLNALSTSMDEFGKESKTSEENLNDLDTEITNSESKLDSLKEKLSNVASSGFNAFLDHAKNGLIVLAVRTIAWGVELREAINQEKGFADANRMFEGTAEQVQKMDDKLKNLAVTNLAMPVEEIQHLAKVAGSMGKTGENVTDFIQVASEAALSFNQPAEQMMQSLGGIQTAINLTDNQLATFTDQVKIAADTIGGKTTEGDIMSVLADGVTQAGHELGLAAGQAIAFASTALAIDGNVSKASNSLFNLFFSLKNVKGQTQDFKNTLIGLGIPLDKFAQDIKSNPENAIISLLEKLKTLQGESKNSAIAGIVGGNTNQQATLLSLIENIAVLKSQLKATSDETIYAGKVHEAYAKKLDTADAKIQLLKNSVSLMAAAFINPFLPAVKIATDVLIGFTDWLRKSSENNPFVEIIFKVAQVFLSLGGAIHVVNLLFAPFVLLIGATIRGFLLLSPLLLSVTGYITSLSVRYGLLVASQLAVSQSTNILGLSLIRLSAAFTILKNGFTFLVGGTFGLIGIAVSTLIASLIYLLDKTISFGSETVKVSRIIRAAWDIAIAAITPFIDLLKTVGVLIAVFGSAIALYVMPFGAAIVLVSGLIIGLGAAIDFVFYKITGQFIKLDGILYALGETVKTVANFFIAGFDLVGKSIGFAIAQARQGFKNISEDYKVFRAQVGQLANTDYVGDYVKAVENELKKRRAIKANPSSGKKIDNSNLTGIAGKEELDAQKKQIDLIAKLNKEQRDREIQAVRDKEEENIRTYQASGAKQTEIDAKIFAEKLKTNQAIDQLIKKSLDDEQAELKKLADAKHNFTNEELTAKKEALNQIETAYRTQIKTLNDLEKDHRDKAIQAQRDIENLHKTAAEKIREIERAGMSDYQLQYDKELEIAQKTAEMKTQIKRGEFAAAAESGKKLQEITSAAAMDAAKTGKETGESYQGTLALAKYRESIQLTEQALKGLKAEENSKANQADAEGNTAKAGLATVTERINALDNALRGKELKIIADIGPVTQLKAELDKIPAVTEKKIHISYDANGKPIAWSDLITNLNINSGAKSTAVSPQSVNTKNTQATVVSGGLNVTVNANGLSTIEPTIKKWAVDAVIAKINQENRSNQ